MTSVGKFPFVPDFLPIWFLSGSKPPPFGSGCYNVGFFGEMSFSKHVQEVGSLILAPQSIPPPPDFLSSRTLKGRRREKPVLATCW